MRKKEQNQHLGHQNQPNQNNNNNNNNNNKMPNNNNKQPPSYSLFSFYGMIKAIEHCIWPPTMEGDIHLDVDQGTCTSKVVHLYYHGYVLVVVPSFYLGRPAHGAYMLVPWIFCIIGIGFMFIALLFSSCKSWRPIEARRGNYLFSMLLFIFSIIDLFSWWLLGIFSTWTICYTKSWFHG